MGAAAGVDRDFAEAFGTFLGRRIGRLLATMHAGDQRVNGKDDEKVNCRRDQDKGDASIDEVIEWKCDAAYRELQGRELLSAAGSQLYQRIQESRSEPANHAGKGCADDHADGHIHDVAAQDELLEAV